MLTHTDVGRFEHVSDDGDVAALRRPLYDWLERRAPDSVVREELLELVTSVADEIGTPSPAGFTVTADNGGENVLVCFIVHRIDRDVPTRLGRGLAASDRLAGRLSVDVVPTVGNRYVVLDVLFPR